MTYMQVKSLQNFRSNLSIDITLSILHKQLCHRKFYSSLFVNLLHHPAGPSLRQGQEQTAKEFYRIGFRKQEQISEIADRHEFQDTVNIMDIARFEHAFLLQLEIQCFKVFRQGAVSFQLLGSKDNYSNFIHFNLKFACLPVTKSS